MPNPNIKIAMFPDHGGNPYIDLLRSSLQSAGASFISGHHGLFGWKWLINNTKRNIIIYVHWLSGHYTKQRIPSITMTIKLLMKLVFIKLRGCKLIWNCHNVMPHESDMRRWLHILVRWMFSYMADIIFIHSEMSRFMLQKHFHCSYKCIVIPHGNFIGIYGRTLEKSTCRHILKYKEDEFIYCFLGRLRRYKGLELLIDAFLKTSNNKDRLIITGMAEPEYEHKLNELVKEKQTIQLQTKWLSNNNIPIYISAANVMVFPFIHILNSGSVILAMSYSALCIVPRLGSLPEILPEDSAIYFDPYNPTSLTNAMVKARSLNKKQAEEIKNRAYKAASLLSWETAAQQVVKAIGSLGNKLIY